MPVVPPAVELAAGRNEVAEASAEREAWVTARAAMLRERTRGIELVSASSIKVEPRPLVAEAATSGRDEGPMIDVGSAPPLELGDAFHRVMELVTLPDACDLEELASAICAEAGILEAVEAVVQMARRCIASPVVQRAVSTGALHREVPFVTEQDGGSRGKSGLLFRGPQGLVIVDYKTDAVEPGDEQLAAEAHRGQMRAYAQGVRPAGETCGAHLLFARTGTCVNLGSVGSALHE